MTVSSPDIFSLPVRKGTLSLSARCRIMGILNVTPDSFSDGGKHVEVNTAVEHSLNMEKAGADIIDIGGESTRPGARELSVDEELNRVLPVITELRAQSDIPISIDTRKSDVADAALDAGADIINDISALRHDARMASVAAARAVPVILMHMKGSPADMQDNPQYDDVVEEQLTFFHERLQYCESEGIMHPIIDPGIGFGKLLEHNLSILRGLPRFHTLKVPLLVGSSRKAFIGQLTGMPVEDRLGGSIASSVLAFLQGAHILRVHDVRETRSAIDVTSALATKEISPHVV